MEQTEHAFLRQLGIRVQDTSNGFELSWPRVAASCEYVRPLVFDDEFDIELTVERVGGKSVTYRCEFRLGDEVVATGRMTSVCCRMENGSAPYAVAIPDEMVKLLTPYQVST